MTANATSIEALDDVVAGVMAYRGSRSQLIGVAITPYRRGETILITTALAHLRKAELVRQRPEIEGAIQGTQHE